MVKQVSSNELVFVVAVGQNGLRCLLFRKIKDIGPVGAQSKMVPVKVQ